MAHGEFLWCDLATFDVVNALKFYGPIFDWDLKSEEFADGSIYYYASNKNDVIAGIYEMPREYRESGMDSFWMSYIGVDDVVEAIKTATAHGGNLVLGPATFGHGATIAMLEDPFGAKFTVFSGSHLQPRSMKMVHGAHFWNELYTTDTDQAIDFYTTLFNWKISNPDANGRARVDNLADRLTTAIHQINEDTPIKTPQWTVSFASEEVEEVKSRLLAAAVPMIENAHNAPGRDICVKDPNGAIFFISQIGERRNWFTGSKG